MGLFYARHRKLRAQTFCALAGMSVDVEMRHGKARPRRVAEMSARIELGRKIARQQRVDVMGERVHVAIEEARQQRDSVRCEAMQAEAAQPEPVPPEPVQLEPVQPEPAQDSAPRVERKPAPQQTIIHEERRREDVSQATLRRNHIIAGLKGDMRADAFRVLRVKVLQKMREEGWSTLGITSAAPGDGKTLMAVNLSTLR